MTLTTNRYSNYIRQRQVKISALVLFFYLVGLIGMLLPMTNALFLGLIPFALILSFLVLSFFHASTIESKRNNFV